MEVFHELESLPAAPPSPTARMLIGSSLGFLLGTFLGPTTTNEPLGLVYVARVKRAQNRMRIGDKWITLSPGMAVTAKIKTGARRLIEYFLSPAVEMKSESVGQQY
jgi:hypothetical protein